MGVQAERGGSRKVGARSFWSRSSTRSVARSYHRFSKNWILGRVPGHYFPYMMRISAVLGRIKFITKRLKGGNSRHPGGVYVR
jgi:hypothetical protein